jgi:RNA polymerase sigma factor (sigma-70 family)
MDYGVLSDRELEALICGEADEEAVAVYLRRVVGEMMGVAMRTFHIEKHEAEDAVGNVLSTFCEKRRKLRPERVKGWLYQTLIYHCLHHCRRRKRVANAKHEIRALSKDASAYQPLSPIHLDVRNAVFNLQKTDQELLYYLLVEGKTAMEVSQDMDLSSRQIEERKGVALRKLKKAMERTF